MIYKPEHKCNNMKKILFNYYVKTQKLSTGLDYARRICIILTLDILEHIQYFNGFVRKIYKAIWRRCELYISYFSRYVCRNIWIWPGILLLLVNRSLMTTFLYFQIWFAMTSMLHVIVVTLLFGRSNKTCFLQILLVSVNFKDHFCMKIKKFILFFSKVY